MTTRKPIIAKIPPSCPTSLKSWSLTPSLRPSAPKGRGTAVLKSVKGTTRKCWARVVDHLREEHPVDEEEGQDVQRVVDDGEPGAANHNVQPAPIGRGHLVQLGNDQAQRECSRLKWGKIRLNTWAKIATSTSTPRPVATQAAMISF